jgi:hypothetical protein
MFAGRTADSGRFGRFQAHFHVGERCGALGAWHSVAHFAADETAFVGTTDSRFACFHASSFVSSYRAQQKAPPMIIGELQ